MEGGKEGLSSQKNVPVSVWHKMQDLGIELRKVVQGRHVIAIRVFAGIDLHGVPQWKVQAPIST